MPNPSYIFWNENAFLKASVNEEALVEVQVCGEVGTQSPNACHPYICESENLGSSLKISRSFSCLEETNVETDLLGMSFERVKLVNNNEDWFSRIQYWFDL